MTKEFMSNAIKTSFISIVIFLTAFQLIDAEGGPNGKIDTGLVQMKVVDGKYIEYKKRYQTYDLGQLLANKYVEAWHEATANIPMQNSEVFSKYRWSMDESVEESKCQKNGKRRINGSGDEPGGRRY